MKNGKMIITVETVLSIWKFIILPILVYDWKFT